MERPKPAGRGASGGAATGPNISLPQMNASIIFKPLTNENG